MKLTLVPLKEDYLEFLRKVRNLPEINKYLFTDVHISKKAQEKWYKNRYLKDKSYLIFIALDKNIPIGYGQITHLDFINLSCEVGFCVFPIFQGKGYGKTLVKKMVNYTIKKLKMHRIYLEVFTVNKKAIKLYEKCGFKKEGILRDKIFKHKNFHDVVIMSIIAKRFYASSIH